MSSSSSPTQEAVPADSDLHADVYFKTSADRSEEKVAYGAASSNFMLAPNNNSDNALHSFKSAPSQPVALQPNESELRKCFLKVDADGSGKLSKQEIKSFFEKHGHQISDKDIDDAICFADTNKDGQVDLSEFVGVRCHSPVVMFSLL